MSEQLVYYYCNLSTAVSVLKNRELWMTSIRNLNDSNESVAVYKLFFKLLEEYDKGNNKLTSLLEYAKTPGAIQMYSTPLGAYPEYIACFSKNPDSVSQWIAYADNGQGVAIGFDETELERVAEKEGLKYQVITYVSEEDIQSLIPDTYEYLIENLSGNNMEMMDTAMTLIMKFFPEGVSNKTIHYASESEKRIIYDYPTEVENLPDGWEIKDIGVYAKRNLINTYVPLGFPMSAVKAIVTGPKYEKNYYEVELAMEALGYLDVAILESTSGYR